MSRVYVLVVLALGCVEHPGSKGPPPTSSGPDTTRPTSTEPETTPTDGETDPGTDGETLDTGTAPTVDTGTAPIGDTGTAPSSPPGPGCAGSPYALVQDAIDAAAEGDVIEVCAGTFVERLTIDGLALTLHARDGAAATIIDATGGGQALAVTGGADVVLEGFTFRNGVTADNGGNIACTSSALVIRDSVIEVGEAVSGGGVSFEDCTGLVEDNTFRDNHAVLLGGGLYLEGTVNVLRNLFETNGSDQDGGGAYVSTGFGSIEGNVVRLNTAIMDGAGVYVDGGAPAVDGNTFEENDTDGEGGGLRVKLSNATITNNTFTANHADYRGGGCRVSHDESVFSGNTWVGNTTWGTGGALFLYESASSLSFEVFEGNEADQGGAIAITAGWDGPVIEDSVFDLDQANLGAHLYVDLLGYTTRLRRVDLLNGEADVSGGAVYATAGSDVDFGNVVFAGNTAAASGGALGLDGVSGRIHNSVVIWNDAPDGAGLTVTNGVALDVSNTVFVENTGGAAVSFASGVPPTFGYDDFTGNAGDYAGMADLGGQTGNLAAAPDFVDAAGGDYTLAPSSALIDQGDPAVTDPDGSRSDIGRFGGPDAG